MLIEIFNKMKPINYDSGYYPRIGMKNLYFQTDDSVIRHGKYDFNDNIHWQRRWIDDDNNEFTSGQILRWVNMDNFSKESIIRIDLYKEQGNFYVVDKALDNLVNDRVSSIEIENVNTSSFIDHYDCDVDEFEGRDGDWWGTMEYKGVSLEIEGCAYYGTVNIFINDEEEY